MKTAEESRYIPNILKKRAFMAFICLIGVVAVSYGIHYHDNLVFIIGIGFIIVGYLLIRRRIKGHITDNQ